MTPWVSAPSSLRGGSYWLPGWFEMMYMLRCSVLSDSFVTPWTMVREAPLSLGFFRSEIMGGPEAFRSGSLEWGAFCHYHFWVGYRGDWRINF